MDAATHLVCFTLDDQTFALRLDCVERVVRVVEITPLPQAPEVVLGVINIQGRVMPIMDLRRRFGLPARQMELDDQFIVAHTARRQVGLLVDTVTGVVPLRQEDITAAEQLASTPCVEGVLKLNDGLAVIHNLDAFLQGNEDSILEKALQLS